MRKLDLAVGDPVRVTGGIYAGTEGEIEDLHPECSVMRIRAKDGAVYALLDTVQRISPSKALVLKNKPLKK